MEPRSEIPAGAVEIGLAGEMASVRSFALRTIEGVPPDAVYALRTTSRIGRSEESEIVLLDPGVSRAHAIIEVAGGKALVRRPRLNQRNVSQRAARRNRIASGW